MGALGRVIVKEFIQLRRDRKMLPAMIIGPLMQLLAFGYAANTDVADIPLLLVDHDRTPASRDLLESFTAGGWFRLAGAEDSDGAVAGWLLRGAAQAALVVPRGYGQEIAAGRTGAVQLIVDGSDASSAVVGLGYAGRIVARLAGDLLRERATRLEVRTPPGGSVVLEPRVFYNPDLRSRWFYVPAILAMTLLLTTMILPSMAIVREKEIGTLEQLLVTPLRPWQLLLGKLAPFVLVGIFNTALITTLAVLLFGVPLRGSFWLLLLLTLPFLLTTLGLGLLVSTLVRTQQQAMVATTYLLMVPMIYLSGLIFPIENMPPVIRAATVAIPLRYYGVIIRAIFLKGSGFEALWREGLFLTLFGTAALGLAAWRFRKRLD